MTKRKIKRTCPDCWGSGKRMERDWNGLVWVTCARCSGTGEVEVEVEVNDGR